MTQLEHQSRNQTLPTAMPMGDEFLRKPLDASSNGPGPKMDLGPYFLNRARRAPNAPNPPDK
eukprot:118873-Lingulodinium_polyedra.AAC.1